MTLREVFEQIVRKFPFDVRGTKDGTWWPVNSLADVDRNHDYEVLAYHLLPCTDEPCQLCCPHDERDHGICLVCAHEEDPGEAIDRAMDALEDR